MLAIDLVLVQLVSVKLDPTQHMPHQSSISPDYKNFKTSSLLEQQIKLLRTKYNDAAEPAINNNSLDLNHVPKILMSNYYY